MSSETKIIDLESGGVRKADIVRRSIDNMTGVSVLMDGPVVGGVFPPGSSGRGRRRLRGCR
jgi:hypothetical protein